METKIKHKYDCQRVFKNYDKTCGRCLELMNGAKPRKGWGLSNDAKRCAEIRAHNCKERNCGVVCTFGEW